MPDMVVIGALLLLGASHHQRLETSRGPVHVLEVGRPTLTVVYVHGYWDDVDEAWSAHRLHQQFEAAGIDALFIAPEAPTGPKDPVRWTSVDALVETVEAQRGRRVPGQVIAMGHSGAVRTLEQWVTSQRLITVVLLDAFYGEPEVWERWLASNPQRRMMVLSQLTADNARPFCERAVRTECTVASHSHMEIVTSGEVLPELLRRLSSFTPRT